MRTLYSKFPKERIAELPVAVFEGRIEVVDSVSVAERAVEYLLRQPLLGFDTETRPTFRKGEHHAVALLQVCAADICFLFRLNRIGLPECVLRLLSDRTITKVGLSLCDDLPRLAESASFQRGTFVELQDYVKQFGIEDMSLQKLYANVFGQKISKRQQLTNWEADVLTEQQKRYAATDAWACIRLYEELQTLAETRRFRLVAEE